MVSELFLSLVAAAAALTPPGQSTASSVRSLPIHFAQTGRPVRLSGTVTFSAPPHNSFYLQDDSGGVRVVWPKADVALQPGDRVDVIGLTTVERFLPEVRAVRVTVRKGLTLPPAVPFNLSTAESGYLDGEWVEVEAVVQYASVHAGWLQIDLSRGGADAVAMIPLPLAVDVTKAEGLSGAVVRVRGVCRASPNAQRRPSGQPRLFVTAVTDFKVLRAPPEDPFDRPAVRIADLAMYRPDPLVARLPVRVSGVVTLNQSGKLAYVQDDTGVIHITWSNQVQVEPGQRVEVVGFPRLRTEPTARLDNAEVRVVGEGPRLPPEPGTVADAVAGRLEGRVARFVGVVREVGKQGPWTTLTLSADALSFTAILLDPEATAEVGSTVEVIGVVTKLPFEKFRPFTFAVVTRPGALTVLEGPPRPPEPPWWTTRRVAYLSAAFLGLTLVGGAAVTALRAQVRRAAMLARAQSEEKTRLEGRLEQAAKLEAAGRVAGGVAHDFNNILTVINGCAQMLGDEITTDPAHAMELAVDIGRAGRLASVISRLLLTFSRHRTIIPHPLDVNAVVSDAAPILARLVGERTAFQMTTDPNLPPALADTGLLLQVLINLAANAGEAMPTGGAFALTTSTAGPEWVRIVAADTGMGMPRDVQARAFERGFTTKTTGTGTGLWTVAEIVRTLGGRIRVHSEVGRGTVFEIDLPAAAKSLDVPTVSAQSDNTEPASTVTPVFESNRPVALFVDDDEAVRTFASYVLEQAGLAVLCAAGPEEALRVLAGHAGEIGILVTDVQMSGVGGKQLADSVRALHPDIGVLFISGYPADDARLLSVLEGGEHFLHKPFSPDELIACVRRILAELAGERPA